MTSQKIKKHIEDQLKNAKNTVDLKGLGLTHFPIELCDYPEIEILDLSENFLTEIPSEISNLVNLRTLTVQKNKLRNISKEINHLSRLRILDFYFNDLKEFPDILKHFPFLTELNLAYNQLSILPESITQCQQLETLNISYNEMTTLPKIGYLPNLTKLNISYTEITDIDEHFLYCKPNFHLQIATPVLFLKEYLIKGSYDFEHILKSYHNEIVLKTESKDIEVFHDIFCNKTEKFKEISLGIFFSAIGLNNDIIHKNALQHICSISSKNQEICFQENEEFSIWGNTILDQEQYLERAESQSLSFHGQSLAKYIIIGKGLDGDALFARMESIDNHYFLTERQFNLALEQKEEKFFYAEAKQEEIENVRSLLYADQENVELALTMLPSLGVPKDFLTDLLLIQLYQPDNMQSKIDELIYLYASDILLNKLIHFKTTNLKLEAKTFVRNLQYWTSDTELDAEKVKVFRKKRR